MPTELTWTWNPPDDRCLQGHCHLGICLIIWNPSHWTVWAVPKGVAKRVPTHWEIPVERGWEVAFDEAAEWAAWVLKEWHKENARQPHHESSPSEKEHDDFVTELLEWLQPAWGRVKEWLN